MVQGAFRIHLDVAKKLVSMAALDLDILFQQAQSHQSRPGTNQNPRAWEIDSRKIKGFNRAHREKNTESTETKSARSAAHEFGARGRMEVLGHLGGQE